MPTASPAPTTSPEASSAPADPVAPVGAAPAEPAAPRAAAVDATPPASPPPPGAVADWLNYAGVSVVSQVDRVVLGPRGQAIPVQALVFVDEPGVHLCVAIDGDAPSCRTLRATPTYTTGMDVSWRAGEVRVHTSFGHASGFVTVDLVDDSLVATFEPRGGQPPVPFEDVEPMTAAPPLFAALAGYELRMLGTLLVARDGAEARACERGAAGFVCTAARRFDELEWEHLVITDVRADYPGLAEIHIEFNEQEGDVYRVGEAFLYLRQTETDLTLLAYVVVHYEHVSRVSNDNDDIEVVSMNVLEVEMRQASCLFIGPPTQIRLRELANGRTRTLRPAPLRRAPSTVPVTGVDPLTVSLAGAWAIEPQGGLRRIPRCDYED